MAATQELPGRVAEERVEELLADAGEFFEAYLWESGKSENAHSALEEKGLKRKVVRAFGVGYAPIGPDVMMRHLRGLGYTDEELMAAGLATRSVRGRAHTYFRSRVMFPVRDQDGRILGFAGLGTHLGPSWPLWVTSPDGGPYRRAHAVYGIDLAAKKVAASKTALVKPDCLEVLRAHQDGRENAVTVHSNELTRDQIRELAGGVKGGIEALELKLPPGMQVEPKRRRAAPELVSHRPQPVSEEPRPRLLNLKRVAIVAASALAATIAWTGAPLLAVWVGSQVQSGRLVSMRGVVTVVAVLAVLEFLLGVTLTWLNARYDRLTGRPHTAALTSPWHRTKRGDRVDDIRIRYGVSAPEKAVAACVVAGVLVFEIWFFFFAGSSLANT